MTINEIRDEILKKLRTRCNCTAHIDSRSRLRLHQDLDCARAVGLGLKKPCVVGRTLDLLRDPQYERPLTVGGPRWLQQAVNQAICRHHERARIRQGVVGQVERRSQHAKQSRRGYFHGPDTYVAVVTRPKDYPEWDGELRRDRLHAAGYRLRRFGEGYREHDGPRSYLGQALASAWEYVDKLITNRKQDVAGKGWLRAEPRLP